MVCTWKIYFFSLLDLVQVLGVNDRFVEGPTLTELGDNYWL